MIQKKICVDCEQALDLFRFTKRPDGSYRAKCQNCALGIKAGAIVFIDGDEPPAALLAPERRTVDKKIMAVSDKGSDYTRERSVRTKGGSKICPCCKKELELAQFRGGYCIPCDREKSKIRQRENYAKNKLQKEQKRAPSNKVHDGCKKCRDCEEVKPIDSYFPLHATDKGARQYEARCKSCSVIYRKNLRNSKLQPSTK